MAGVAGAAALAVGSASSASANYPDPPDMVVSLSSETAPSTCPTSAPAGTFPAGTNVKALCDRAVAGAPSDAAAAAIRYMFSKLGASYSQSNRYSINPPVFDCTSFVSRAYTAAKAPIIRNDRESTWIANFGWTGAYMPSAYEGTNLQRLSARAGDISGLLPGDVMIQFSGSNPAGSAGNNGHAQVYLGDGLVIQSGGNHPQSLANVTRHSNWFSNEWYFRYQPADKFDPIGAKWRALGGASGIVGKPVAATEPNSRGGLTRRYERGHIYWSKETGAAAVYGGILQTYANMGYERSPLGLPISDEVARGVPGSRGNTFQNGLILWSPGTGGHAVEGGIAAKYIAMGAERSILGLPVSGEGDGPFPGSRRSSFERGAILWSGPTGAHDISGGMAMRYIQPGVAQVLGLPTSSEVASRVAGVPRQNFQRGVMYWTPSTGSVEVAGGILASYNAMGAETSILRMPRSPEKAGPFPGTRMQEFLGGALYWSGPTGAQPLSGGMAMRYAQSGVAQILGLPTSGELPSRVPGVPKQNFQRGVMYWTPSTGAVEVYGGILGSYSAIGAEASPLGVPRGPERAGVVPGSRVQDFSGGGMYWSGSTGAHPVYGPIGERYRAIGGEGALGLPTTGTVRDGGRNFQAFQRGMLVADGAAVYEVVSAIGDRYRALGGERSMLGFPVSSEAPTAVPGVTVQQFQRGVMYRSSAGAWEVYGGILAVYRSLGAERSGLGAPSSGEVAGPLPGTRMNTFVNGALVWSGPTGAQPIMGDMWKRYQSGNLGGIIGLPTGLPRGAGVAGAAMQDFQRGAMYWSAATGAHETYGGIGAVYRSIGGATSRLGLPTSGEYSIANGRAQNFQRGQITFDSRNGATQVRY